MTAENLGQLAALQKYGFDVHKAVRYLASDDPIHTGPGILHNLANLKNLNQQGISTPTAITQGLKNTAKSQGDLFYRFFVQPETVGSPLGLNDQIKREGWKNTWINNTFGRRPAVPTLPGHIERGLMTFLNVGSPLINAYIQSKRDPDRKAEFLSGAAANLMAAPFVNRLGLPGMALQIPINLMGSAVGKYIHDKFSDEKTAGVIDFIKRNPIAPLYGLGVGAYGVHKLMDYRLKAEQEEMLKRERALIAAKSLPRLLATMSTNKINDTPFENTEYAGYTNPLFDPQT